jgi:hypothetical protein
MAYGIKISLPGYDVKTATIDQLSVDSTYPSFKIAKKGALSKNVSGYHDPGGTFVYYDFTIPHNLGYKPGFWVFGINNDTDNDYRKSPFNPHGEVGVSAAADETNLIVGLTMASWTMTTNLWVGNYFIFYDEVA